MCRYNKKSLLITVVNALNIAWVVVSLTVGLRLFRSGGTITSARLRRITALLMAAVALFPVVSASDDLVRFAFLGSSALHTHAQAGTPLSDDSDQQPAQALARLLDSLDSVQITPVSNGWFFLVLVAFLACCAPIAVERRVCAQLGRAPPVA